MIRFFNIGLTIADLKASGAMQFASEELITTVIAGQIESMMVHRRGTGMGSTEEELRLLDSTGRTQRYHFFVDIKLQMSGIYQSNLKYA